MFHEIGLAVENVEPILFNVINVFQHLMSLYERYTILPIQWFKNSIEFGKSLAWKIFRFNIFITHYTYYMSQGITCKPTLKQELP